jgi:hypothetical protein
MEKNRDPLDVSHLFLYTSIFEHPNDLGKLDNTITKNLHKKLKNNNELEKFNKVSAKTNLIVL